MKWLFISLFVCLNTCIENPLVSVVVPVYNTKKDLLTNCLDDLINQSYMNIEIIVVDDGSMARHIRPILTSY